MNNNDDSSHLQLTRRELIRRAGLAGLAVAGMAVAFPNLSSGTVSAQDETPEGFIAWAYKQKAQAMSTNNPKLLQAIYDPSNTQLLAFETEGIKAAQNLGSQWQGTILGYDSTVSLIDLSISGSLANVRIYETLRIVWIPTPRPISPADQVFRQQYPEKFISLTPKGAKGEIASSIGMRHEIDLEKQTGGWLIIRDSYEQPMFGGRSPDLKPGAWSSVPFGLHSFVDVGSPLEVPQIQVSPSCTTYYYNWTAARDYATGHCNSYNSNYCNLGVGTCGGDCANFVSQCLRNGGQRNDGTWYTYGTYHVCGAGDCGLYSSYNAPSNAWGNDGSLRSWVINSGRGVSKTSFSQLGTGDLVNYLNSGGYSYHVTIVTDPVNGLVCSHTYDFCNVPWNDSRFGATSYQYTWVNVSYCV